MNRYQRTAMIQLLISVGLMLLSWRWASATYASGRLHEGYYIGLAGSALPALALGANLIRVKAARQAGDESADVSWLKPLFWVSIVFLVLMMLFPLM